MAKKTTINYENPVVQYQDNLIMTNKGDVWAYYRLQPFQINVANVEEKRRHKENLIDVLERLQKYHDVDMKLLPANMDLEGRIRGTEADWAKDIDEVAQYYIGQEEVAILESEFNPATIDEFYIGVKLKASAVGDSLTDKLLYASDLTFRRIAESLRFSVKFTDEFFSRFETMNDDILNLLNVLNGRKVSEKELVKVLGFAYNNPTASSLARMRETVFELADPRIIRRNNGEQTDYISHVVLSLPDSMTNLELIPVIQSLKFPVEVHIKMSYPERGGMNGLHEKARAFKVKFKSEKVDADLTGDDSSKKSDVNFSLASDLVDKLDNQEAFMEWTIMIVVRDSDKEALKKKLRKVKDRITGYDRAIEVLRPMFNQEMLLYQGLPGQDLGVYKHWRQYTSAPAMAQMLFDTTVHLGMNTGFYIGRSLDDKKNYKYFEEAIYSSRNLVLLNPSVTNKGIKGAKTDSPHIVITGETGQGKSFLVKNLLLNMAMFDDKILYVDPKQEVKRWFNRALENENNPYFRKLLNAFHYVTLNANDNHNRGVLDPLLTLSEHSSEDDIPMVATLIKEMLLSVRGLGQDIVLDTHLTKAIHQACSKRLAGQKVGTLDILTMMKEAGESAKNYAENLLELIPKSMLKVAFSDGSTDSLQFNDRRTILEVVGLDLPKPKQEIATYTETQKYSVSIMLALGKYLEKFGRENPDEFSVEFIDEAWIFNTSEAGKKVLDGIKRLGRSENNMLCYATQRVEDIANEQSQGQYGQLFAFDDPTDRPNILKHFNLPDTKDNRELLENMTKGQCLFRDIYGHMGKIVVHSLFDEWTTAFKTVNENAGAKLEQLY
ncbi:ATP-binding protein [Fructobacillus cardui]|uniref:ATP-binding protein n=1 Tax=Fructobacillus cardui TaxID=2893170 RepID=UPI002D8F8C09|nr:Archaeal DNA helicase HerA or a related bacterial ATPase [Fructobacillus cardui]